MLGLCPYTVSIQKRTRRELEGENPEEGEVGNDAQGGGGGGGGLPGALIGHVSLT
jgi:hypothetical protein